MRIKPADRVVQNDLAKFKLRQSMARMLSFTQKICLVLATVFSTDVEFIKGNSVKNARLEVGCVSMKELCSLLLQDCQPFTIMPDHVLAMHI